MNLGKAGCLRSGVDLVPDCYRTARNGATRDGTGRQTVHQICTQGVRGSNPLVSTIHQSRREPALNPNVMSSGLRCANSSQDEIY